MSKLNWKLHYDSEWRAEHNGYTIRAVLDEYPSNPFEDAEGLWPTAVRSVGAECLDVFEFGVYSRLRDAIDMGMFSDEALIHNQIHIAQAFGTTVKTMLEELDGWDTGPQPKYCRDAAMLRDAFQGLLEELANRDRLEVSKQLCDLAGWPAYHGRATEYEILVFASPEARVRFGLENRDISEDALKSTARLYHDWADGEVYGFIVGTPVLDEDGDEVDFEEVASCWGFYGCDFAENGLEETALDSVPESAPEIRQVA